MWGWFIVNGVPVLIITLLVLLLLFFGKSRLQEIVRKLMPEKWHAFLDKASALAIRIIEGIGIAILAVSLLAIIASKEGISAMVTTETIQAWFLQHGLRIIIVLMAGVWVWIAYTRFVPPLVRRTMVKARGESREGIKKRTDTLVSVFMGLGKVVIILGVIFIILSELNIPIAPILAGFGIAGIAVGFGAQYLIRDLIAGIFILMENQYRVGDVARVADIGGLVEEVNLRKTVLRDLDGIVHHIPNGEIKVASNFTRHFSRVNLNVSVAYGTDLDHAISVINRVGQELAKEEEWSKVIRTAPQVLRVDNFGDSGIDIKILGEVKPIEQWRVTGELRYRLKKAFDAENIEIPWPHVKLYFGQSQADASLMCKACSHPNLTGSKFCSNCGAPLGSQNNPSASKEP